MEENIFQNIVTVYLSVSLFELLPKAPMMAGFSVYRGEELSSSQATSPWQSCWWVGVGCRGYGQWKKS
jgi:hypothetical protein